MTDEIDALDPRDLMVRILEQIRDELRTTRTEISARIEQTNARIEQTNTRLDSLREDVGGRLAAVEHTLVELATQQRATVTYLREHVAEDLSDLRTRVRRLEAAAT